MYDDLRIIHYPDPRLRKQSSPVETFDDALKQLADRMLVLMREAKGVGLAAPQVGHNIRLFVMNASGNPEDDRVYVNPVLSDGSGDDEAEEGCLSLPGIHIDVVRAKAMRIQAFDLAQNATDETADGYIARIWQHEVDHLNGVLLLDRMGPVAKMTHRRAIREMEDKWAETHPVTKKKR